MSLSIGNRRADAFKVDMDGWAGLCNLQLQRPTDIRAQIAEIAVPAV